MQLSTSPLFTVVVPCFAARDTVAIAIASVLAQSEPRFELIVVDDGSPDDSVAVATAAIGSDPRGRVLRQANAGPAIARNLGAAAGSAGLVAFLDADDRWAPDLLRAHADHFELAPDLGISFARTRFFDAELNCRGRISAYRERLHLADVLAENPLCTTSNIVVRRELFAGIGGFDQEMRHAEDQEFVVRTLATTHWRVAGIDAELVHYRTSESGLSADLDAMEQGWSRMLERARRYTDTAAFTLAERRSRALFERFLARRALRTGQPARRALGHLSRAFRIDAAALFDAETVRTLMTVAGVAAALMLPRRLINPIISR